MYLPNLCGTAVNVPRPYGPWSCCASKEESPGETWLVDWKWPSNWLFPASTINTRVRTYFPDLFIFF